MAGGSTGGDSSDEAISGINVTPLVDIMLVLLIIFMVTARIIASPNAMAVDLPKAATGTDLQQTVFSVTLAVDGSTTVDSKPVTNDDAILSLAKEARTKNPEIRAAIRADKEVNHGRVMHVLDILRQAQVSKVGFVVAPSGSAAPRK